MNFWEFANLNPGTAGMMCFFAMFAVFAMSIGLATAVAAFATTREKK